MLPYFAAIDVQLSNLLPERVLQFLLQLELDSKAREVSNGLLVVLDETADTGTWLSLVYGGESIIVFDCRVAAVFNEWVYGLVILVYYGQM